jgi:hypothetical protein
MVFQFAAPDKHHLYRALLGSDSSSMWLLASRWHEMRTDVTNGVTFTTADWPMG